MSGGPGYHLSIACVGCGSAVKLRAPATSLHCKRCSINPARASRQVVHNAFLLLVLCVYWRGSAVMLRAADASLHYRLCSVNPARASRQVVQGVIFRMRV